ncbi:MAG TPA: glycosyltransferase [Caulobacteraceae bacterium]
MERQAALRLALVGKAGSITHWLEEAAAAWRGDGHEVRLALVRRPWLAAPLESALAGPIAKRLTAGIDRFAPDLILAIGAFHVPPPLLAAIAAMPGRPPLVGWVGDVFDATAAARAALYDLLAYADRALLERHRALGFTSAAMYLPHAVNPHGLAPMADFAARAERMVFVGNPTPLRRAIIEAINAPAALYGPGWKRSQRHEAHPGRLAAARAPEVLAAHRFALNIRNELNVLTGLNQRNFQPCAAGATLLTDDQPDLAACFEPGAEVLVWRDTDELNALYAKVRREPGFAAVIAARGRARVMAEHTYAHRLANLTAALGSS